MGRSRQTTPSEPCLARRRDVFWPRGPWRSLIALVGLLALAANTSARAQNATWSATPGSGNFNTGANWSPAIVPTGVATFGASSVTGLSLSSNTTIGGWTFNAGNYVITNPGYAFIDLTFDGAGITINGGGVTIVQNGFLNFDNSSTAGGAVILNGYMLNFNDTSSAGAANITNGGQLAFNNAASAGSANIVNNNTLSFVGASTAGAANITNNENVYFSN